MDATHVKSVHASFGSRSRGDFPIVSFFDFYIKYPFILKMEVLRPLNLLPYNKEEAIRILERDYGWRYYGGKHYESRWTRFFQAFYLPYKFGYDKRKAHLSSLVLSGQMSRNEALNVLKEPLYETKLLEEDKIYIAKKLGLSTAEFEELIMQPAQHYSKFPNHQRKKHLAMTVFRAMQIMIGMSKRFALLPFRVASRLRRKFWPKSL